MSSNSAEECPENISDRLVIAVGASAGGLKEVALLVEMLPVWFEGTVIIACHREPDRPNMLANILAHRARVEVKEPHDDECMEETTVYIGRPSDSVSVEPGGKFEVVSDKSMRSRRRRIDDLFTSVAEAAKDNSVGVIFSGMLSDGMEGLRAIHNAGGFCIVQSPEDAQYDSMPRNALKAVPVSYVGTTEEIASMLLEYSLVREI
ncbi:MAG: chemotaxis protein CheB [Planctomycetaceae bacterium]